MQSSANASAWIRSSAFSLRNGKPSSKKLRDSRVTCHHTTSVMLGRWMPSTGPSKFCHLCGKETISIEFGIGIVRFRQKSILLCSSIFSSFLLIFRRFLSAFFLSCPSTFITSTTWCNNGVVECLCVYILFNNFTSFRTKKPFCFRLVCTFTSSSSYL